MCALAGTKIRRMAEAQMVDTLSNLGQKLIEQAWAEKDTTTRTGNQDSAYGWGVYRDGKLLRHGFLSVPTPTRYAGGTKHFGSYYIYKFLELVPSWGLEEVCSGMSLVVANAMWYSTVHEAGHTPTGKIYRVLSQVYGRMRNASEVRAMLGGAAKIKWVML